MAYRSIHGGSCAVGEGCVQLFSVGCAGRVLLYLLRVSFLPRISAAAIGAKLLNPGQSECLTLNSNSVTLSRIPKRQKKQGWNRHRI